MAYRALTQNEEKMKTLYDLKVGDLILEKYRYDTVISKITAITPTQIVVGRCRYRKKDGRLVGNSDSWFVRKIEIPTEDDIRKIKEKRIVHKVLTRMRNTDTITYDQAVAISKILGIDE